MSRAMPEISAMQWSAMKGFNLHVREAVQGCSEENEVCSAVRHHEIHAGMLKSNLSQRHEWGMKGSRSDM